METVINRIHVQSAEDNVRQVFMASNDSDAPVGALPLGLVREPAYEVNTPWREVAAGPIFWQRLLYAQS
jgi:hypothetical protein